MISGVIWGEKYATKTNINTNEIQMKYKFTHELQLESDWL